MSTMDISLLPRARLRDVLGGRARLVGSRVDARRPRGVLSPIEPRLRMGIPYGDLRAAEANYLARRSVRTDLGVLFRAAVASLLAPAKTAKPDRRPFIVSARVDNLTIDEALENVFVAPNRRRARLLYFVHAHALTLARYDRAYRQIIAEADALLPDGIGLRLAGRLLGVSLRHNLNGTDLFPLLCAEAARRHIPLALVGGQPGVANACAARMQEQNPGLEIPFVAPGYFASAGERSAAITRLAAIGRVVVLVGMGSPRQERWSWEYLRDLPQATVLTVGGLFDFYSGRIARAPIFWREAGLEWLYRMGQEPRRLARRYLVGNPLFLSLALAQRLRGARALAGGGMAGGQQAGGGP